jgi:hypothetical protein
MLRAPALALTVAVGALALSDGAAAETSFDPYFEVYASPEPQAPTELTINFGLRNGRDAQFSAVVFYLPGDWGVARGDAIPIGTKVGRIRSVETLGLINSACNTAIPIDFELFNATMDTTQTVPVEIKNADYDYESEFRFLAPEFAADEDGNGLAEVVDRYPEFLVNAFPNAKPLTRLTALTPVAGFPVLLQFLIFPPATRLDLPDRPLAEQLAAYPQSGYPVVMVVQDFRNIDQADEPGPITDYCGPRETTLTFFQPTTSMPLLVNPQSGTYAFTLLAASLRDADKDGIQNSLDTCPFMANAGNSAIPMDGDIDGDGMDVVCDPNDDPVAGGGNSEQDDDGYLNRHDNCPLVSNGQGYDAAGTPLDSPDDQVDGDFDDIGDACDPNPYTPDGEAIIATRSVEVVVGDPSGSGGPPDVEACPHCYRPDAPRAEAVGEGEGTGGQLAVAIGLIAVGAGAAAVVAGSGAVYLIRRRG